MKAGTLIRKLWSCSRPQMMVLQTRVNVPTRSIFELEHTRKWESVWRNRGHTRMIHSFRPERLGGFSEMKRRKEFGENYQRELFSRQAIIQHSDSTKCKAWVTRELVGMWEG